MSLFNRIKAQVTGAPDPDSDPHQWKLPTSYSHAKAGTEVTSIPNPSIFRNAFISSSPSRLTARATVDESTFLLTYPDTSHAAVHLCLLECFRNLRLGAEGYDITSHKPPAYEEKPGAISKLSHHPFEATQRWNAIVDLAVTRFATWWVNIEQVFHHATAYTHHAGNESVVQLSKDYLPPLDVLLVWYAFMLEEVEYAGACRERGMPELQWLCFPWPAIRDLIDRETMTFALPKAASNLFSTLSGQSADILTYLSSPPAYTETPQLPFALDLAAIVMQNQTFIEEAHELLWIRSPSLQGSLDRSLQLYLQLQALDFHKSEPVPFCVDIIWRTHRLYPAQYWEFQQLFDSTVDDHQEHESTKKVRPETEVETEGESTSSSGVSQQQQQEALVEASKICLCWTCERIRDDLPTYIQPTSNSTATITLPSPPLSSLTHTALHSILDDLGFHRATESARQQNLPSLPTRPPTAAEKQAAKELARKKDVAGVLPGIGYYVEVTKSGKRKIRRHKNTGMFVGMGFGLAY